MELVDMARSGSNAGAMMALGKSRDQHLAQRADALEMGRGANNPEQLEKKVHQVAEEFVAVFMNQVMKSMRSTVQENPAMHGDNGEKFFQELLDTEQSKELAKGSGYGLTSLIYESMMSSYRVQQMPGQASGETAPQMDSLRMEQELLEETPERELAAPGMA